MTRDGMVIVGGAVGTDDYIRKHIMDIVTSTLKKVAALTKLHSRQAANVMLVRCVIQALGYHMQVTSPRLAEPAVRAWDDGITEFQSCPIQSLALCLRLVRIYNDCQMLKHSCPAGLAAWVTHQQCCSTRFATMRRTRTTPRWMLEPVVDCSCLL